MRQALFVVALLTAPALAAAPRPVPASDLLISHSSPEIAWRWRMSPEAARAPALLAAMRVEALQAAAKARAAAANDAASARKAGFPFRPHDVIIDWSIAADTPHLLALIGDSFSFTGGAHGNTGFATRIWDKSARRSIAIDALFNDWPRARKIIEPVYCKALADEQARRLGERPRDDMHTCPKLSDVPVAPFAGKGRRASQLQVLLAPYAAGAYAEGPYVITLPWPETVRPFVKPGFRGDLFGE